MRTGETRPKRTGSYLLLLYSVLIPAAAIGIELATGICSQVLWDPIPTPLHLLLVALVPLANLVAWWTLNGEGRGSPLLFLMLSGAIGIAAWYSLLFLPLFPIALFAIPLYGLGLLPYAPLLGLLGGIQLLRRLRRLSSSESRPRLLTGITVALLALLIAELPLIGTDLALRWASATDAATSQRGLSLLRLVGDRERIFQFGQGTAAERPFGLWQPLSRGAGGNDLSAAQAQALWFRVTGIPYQQAPFRTGAANRAWSELWQWDPDLGGESVGGLQSGLSLVASRFDGDLDAAEAAGYLEWSLEFRNDASVNQEARAVIALPPGAVVSRATLWVNGEPREATFTKRGKARRAYQSVVQRQRDPLLVTTAGSDRILVQAFPIPPRGNTLRLRLGIALPLESQPEGHWRVVMPTFLERNFEIAPRLEHALWIESRSEILQAPLGLELKPIESGGFRGVGVLGSSAITPIRAYLSVASAAGVSRKRRVLDLSDPDSPAWIEQQLLERTSAPAARLLLVVDASRTQADYGELLANRLAALDDSTVIGLLFAADQLLELAPQRLQGAHREALLRTLRDAPYRGGQLNGEALHRALTLWRPGDQIIWLHGPQPVVDESVMAALEQRLQRTDSRPQLIDLQLDGGPNKLVADLRDQLPALLWPNVGAADEEIERLIQRITQPLPQRLPLRSRHPVELEEVPLASTDQPVKGDRPSTHSTPLISLWAFEQIREQLAAGNEEGARNLAIRYRLVTPVSGAVVLENLRQYRDNDLKPPASMLFAAPPWMLLLGAMPLLLLLKRVGINRSRTSPSRRAGSNHQG